jgi:hypothetical protein
MRKVAQVFAPANFAFWIQAAMSNARFRSRKRIANYDTLHAEKRRTMFPRK